MSINGLNYVSNPAFSTRYSDNEGVTAGSSSGFRNWVLKIVNFNILGIHLLEGDLTIFRLIP